MTKIIANFNKRAILKDCITGEEIPCDIRARLKFMNAKAVYLNLHRLPKESTLGTNLGKHINVPRYRQRCIPLPKELVHTPYILIDNELNTKTPVLLVSCFYRGKTFCHVRVRIMTDGLKFSEIVEKRSLEAVSATPS